MSEAMDRLLELASQLPAKLRADWDGTNHYELQSLDPGSEEWCWLEVVEVDFEADPSASQSGRRLGLVLDIAAAARAVVDEQTAGTNSC
jgi:hypothetical protein